MKKIGLSALAVIVLTPVILYFFFPEALLRTATVTARYAAGFSAKNVQVDDHRIAYLEGGKGETIVLLHGFGANKDYWTRFSKDLTKRYHVVIPDLPGFGESSRLPKERYDIAGQVRRLERFTEVLKIDRFNLAGNSMGGAIALAYSVNYPAKVITLAVLAPAGIDSPNKTEVVKLFAKGLNPLQIKEPADLDKGMALTFVKPPYIPDVFKKIFIAQAIAQGDFNNGIMKDIVKENLILNPLLPAIQAPVLIMWGDKDKILDISSVYVLEKGLKRHTTVILKDTGHIPMMEKPEETVAAYLKFLGNP